MKSGEHRELRILLTGATGLVGRALAHRLARDGHEVTAWVRDVEVARATLGADVDLLHEGDVPGLVDAMAQVDAVVNLAGSPIARRWTRRALREIRASRVGVTKRLVVAMRQAERAPPVLVQASAIGIYGDAGARPVDEQTPSGHGLLARLCEDWEAAGTAASELGVRVAVLRIGLVLDRSGGVLAPLLPSFSAGLGAVVGPGDQWVSFIHLHDLVEMIATAIVDERWRGAINAVTPHPVPQREFAAAIGAALGPPVRLRVPSFALGIGLGRAARILTDSQRVVPRRAQMLGFPYRFPLVDDAMRAAIDQYGGTVEIRPVVAGERGPDVEGLRGASPAYVLEQRTRIAAPLEEVFAFFNRAENLGAMTPPGLGFRIRSELPDSMFAGMEIRYRISLGPLPMAWRSRIDACEPPHCFVDTQLSGPYRTWVHEHVFERDGEGTKMTDRVWYSPPFGPLGRLANRLFIAPMLRRIFGYRRSVIDLRFGRADGGPRRAVAA